MIELPNVTIACIACNKYGETVASLKQTLKKIKPKEVLLFTDTKLMIDGISVINIPKLDWEGYNRFCVKELAKYVKTDYVLVVQWDAWVLDETIWSDDFLKYDYIGASWLDGVVGNGGGSLRSLRLQKILAEDDTISITAPEDAAIARMYKKHLEDKYDIKFAPREVADRFSFELNEPTQPTFMFHAFHHAPFRPHIVIRRSYALGDVLMVEPLMDYYNSKGYQVVLDTPMQNMALFFNHRYFIKHISQMNEKIVPEKFIDLDGAYEAKPKQSVIQSYFEAAGIKEFTHKNSRLDFRIEPQNKLFDKYVVIHNDDTDLAHRNIREVDWTAIEVYLQDLGYTVLQVGKRNNETVGTWINTNTIQFLVYVLAGADLVIGLDSGVGQIAVALNRPTILLFGSVNPRLRYSDLSNITTIRNSCPIKKDYCYHMVSDSETGMDCEVDKELPPCTKFDTDTLLKAIEHKINKR